MTTAMMMTTTMTAPPIIIPVNWAVDGQASVLSPDKFFS